MHITNHRVAKQEKILAEHCTILSQTAKCANRSIVYHETFSAISYFILAAATVAAKTLCQNKYTEHTKCSQQQANKC